MGWEELEYFLKQQKGGRKYEVGLESRKYFIKFGVPNKIRGKGRGSVVGVYMPVKILKFKN